MKKLIISMLCMSLTAVASEPLWKKIYFRADGGYTFPLKAAKGVELKNTPVYGGGIGFKINEIFRSDINIQVRSNEADKKRLFKNIDSTTLWLNNTVNLTDFEEMTPYFTFGLGVSSNKVKPYSDLNFLGTGASISTRSNKENSFAWNVGAGTTLQLTRNVNLDFAYKFANLGRAALNGTNSAVGEYKFTRKLRAHELLAGVIINLN